MAGQEKSTVKVCVTGGSGYVASWLVKLLLLCGYTVNATVRNLNDPTKTQHLLELDGANERLHLFEANLVQEGSFDAAIDGCDGVFHTATPVILDAPNPQADIVYPAVNGTLNVLASCAKAPTVKRVIFTSSTAAVNFNDRPITEEIVVDETWFSTPEGSKASPGHYWYILSKTLAEDAAWKFAKENGLDLVSIVPALVIGPLLSPTLSYSPAFVFSLINGSETYRNLSCGWVHVKDVAEAHIRAFEIPSANGSYILSERVAHVSEVVKIIHELYPSLKIPQKCENDQFHPVYKYSNRVKSLGMDYIPLKVALEETIQSLKEKKFISV